MNDTRREFLKLCGLAGLGFANALSPHPSDFNHDGVVNSADLLLARLNQGRRLALFDT